MKLIDVILAAEGRVSGGSEYCWHCWGHNARFMEFADINGQEFCTVVFDCKTYNVYDIQVFVPESDQCFIWWNPEFKEAHHHESKVRNIDPLRAYDNIFFTEVDEKTIIEYLKDITATVYEHLPILETV